jgi:hypothetical protein
VHSKKNGSHETNYQFTERKALATFPPYRTVDCSDGCHHCCRPPVGLILCAQKKEAAEAYYALDNLSKKVLAAEYQTVLPDEKLIADELDRSRKELESRKKLRTETPDLPGF